MQVKSDIIQSVINQAKTAVRNFGENAGEIIHSKPDEGYIYSESVYAFVKCKKCNACGPITDVDYNHATSGIPGRLKAIAKAIELAVKGWNRRDGSKANG